MLRGDRDVSRDANDEGYPSADRSVHTRLANRGRAANPASPDELRAMLAPLLAERFHLTVHRETRVRPVYALVVARNGPTFKAGDGGETSVTPNSSGGFKYQHYAMTPP